MLLSAPFFFGCLCKLCSSKEIHFENGLVPPKFNRASLALASHFSLLLPSPYPLAAQTRLSNLTVPVSTDSAISIASASSVFSLASLVPSLATWPFEQWIPWLVRTPLSFSQYRLLFWLAFKSDLKLMVSSLVDNDRTAPAQHQHILHHEHTHFVSSFPPASFPPLENEFLLWYKILSLYYNGKWE